MKKITLLLLVMVGIMCLPIISIAQGTTRWDGSFWDNGLPDPSMDVILDADYHTSGGNIFCKDLHVTPGVSLYIYNATSIDILDTLNNEGFIYESCNITFNYTWDVSAGGFRAPMSPEMMIPGNPYFEFPIGQFASYQFFPANNSTDPVWNSDPLPTGLSMSAGGMISGIADIGYTPDTFSVVISLAENPCLSLNHATAIYIVLISPGTGTFSPNLSIENIFMTYSDGVTKDAVINQPNDASTYRVNTLSYGALTYSISPANECAYIDPNTGQITLTCAGPIYEYTVTVDQAATAEFAAETANSTLYLSKGTPDLWPTTSNTSFIVGVPGYINFYTNSTGFVSFAQVSNYDVATVSSIGEVTPIAEGSFEVIMTVDETDQYLAYSISIPVNVFTTAQPPIAVDDTIEVGVGEEFSINILDNDISFMAELDTMLIDIDMENFGIQGKFLDPGSGSFLIDTAGALYCKPFKGALGAFSVYYTISDKLGNQSYPGRVNINIVQKGEAPELKATELITPNNDGLNDAFVIGYVDHSKTNFLKVFDRNGSEIFTADNYANDWTGTSQNGKSLESGVYYYLFNQNDGEREIQGMIEIRR